MPLNKIFGNTVKNSMLNVHLYFLKLLGCYAIEHDVPLPVKSFAISILSGVAHPHIYLGFLSMASPKSRNEIFVGHIEALTHGPQVVAATWFYIVGGIGVRIGYAEPNHLRFHNRQGWHPDQPQSTIRMAKYDA